MSNRESVLHVKRIKGMRNVQTMWKMRRLRIDPQYGGFTWPADEHL